MKKSEIQIFGLKNFMAISSLMKNASIATVAVVAMILGAVQQASAAPLINGDFETGDLTGWTTFTTSNGTLGDGFPKVVSYDTNNDGIASNSAQFRVGGINFTGQDEGGGIFQAVNLLAGDITISADIASLGGSGDNASGGKVQLLFDHNVLNTYDFGSISPNQPKFSFLSNVSNIAAGLHDIRFLFTRPYLQASSTPTQFIDNIVISGTATQSVPEPTSILGLFAMGAVSAGSVMKRKQE